MTARMRVLIVEDDTTFRDVLAEHLNRREYDAVVASNISEARSIAHSAPPEIIVLDQRLPDGDGVALAQELLALGVATKIILVTAHADLARAVAATRAGVFDYLQKPIELDSLDETISRAARAAETDRQWLKPARRRSSMVPQPLIGGSPATVRLRAQLEAAGRACPAPVLVTGETGAGKNLAARLIHAHSPRVRGPLVEVNCAAIPESIFEAELFGHERGAFTGANESRGGLFESAHGGTLILDEMGELPLLVQSKLLRTLEEGVVRRIGAASERPIDVRVVATTNRVVEDLVEQGLFRRDLYYRVAVFRIELPPLRERLADISLLVWSILIELDAAPEMRPTSHELQVLGAHTWPGNIRELRNVMQRWLVARISGDTACIESFLNPLTPSRVTLGDWATESAHEITQLEGMGEVLEPSAGSRVETLASLEHSHISRVLKEVGNNRSRAAEVLGISRSTLRRKLREMAGT